MTRRVPPCSRRQTGLTLVEVMIGAALGLVVVSALVGFFVSTSRNNRELAQANRQIEAGRFAIQLLERDVVHAGFWGTYVPEFDDVTMRTVPTDAPTSVPDVCLAWNVNSSPPVPWPDAHRQNLVAIPVQAYDDTPTGCASGFLPNRLANTDVLVVRHGALCEAGESGCPSGTLFFQASQCEKELTATPARRFILDTANFTLKKKGCRINASTQLSEGADPAPRRRFISNIYYVRDYALAVGDGIPTLMRMEFDLSSGGRLEHLAPEPLVEGIDGFVIELGVDDRGATGEAPNYAQAIAWQDPNNKSVATNRGDGSPDRYVRCTTGGPCTVTELVNTVAIRLHVLSRSLETSAGHTDTKTYVLGGVERGPFQDAYKRQVFSTSLRLTNISGRR